MELAAWILCLLLTVQVVFQAKLAAGAPWGHISYGGMYAGVLPKNFRIISGVSVFVYLFFIGVVIAYASGSNTYFDDFSRTVLWVMVAFFGLGTIANAASRSKPECWWALYTVAALVSTLFVLDML